MSRATKHRNRNPVSLFPFLAVLLCTMGSLVVILVVLAHQARLQATTVHVPPVISELDESEKLRLEQDELEWELTMHSRARDESMVRLEEHRSRLSGLDDHVHRLEAEWEQLRLAIAKLRTKTEQQVTDREAAAQELAALEREVAAAAVDLERARKERDAARPMYQVVPYEGPHGTHRYPVYIECLSDQVILQPEGVVLTANDFLAPLGPGNPLASAMRAAREHLLRTQSTERRTEPYPLILVRPGGISSYYAVRRALKSWGSDFGYELVESDWDLHYAPPDPALERALREAVEAGRRYQQRLAVSAPRIYGQATGADALSDATGARPGSGLGSQQFGEQQQFASREAAGANGQLQPPAVGSTETGNTSGERRPAPESIEPDARTRADAKTTLPAESFAAGQPQRPSGGAPGPGGPLAASRGRNWALADQAADAVPVRRPLRILVTSDRLVLVDTQHVVPLEQLDVRAIDDLVDAIWQHVGTWGPAGEGLYWLPVLRLQLGPRGENHIRDIRYLLKGSGLEFESASR